MSLTSRQRQRDSRTVNIWPPSPKAHSRELSPHRSHKRSQKRDSSTSSESSSSEEERRRKERKARRKEKEREERSGRREKKRRREKRRSDDEDDSRDNRDTRGRSKDRRHTARSASGTHSIRSSDEEDEWVEKENTSNGFIPVLAPHTTNDASHATVNADDPNSDVEVGPQPLTVTSTSKVDERSYGGALLRGEGSAMAAFLADDVNARIPRRGEIGLTSDEIANYEAAGYVMSGSRHRRMNAVRMRKENQVISAEEKRGILKLQREERERREEVLREEFKELVNDKLKARQK